MKTEISIETVMYSLYATTLAIHHLQALGSQEGKFDDEEIDYYGDMLLQLIKTKADLEMTYQELHPQHAEEMPPLELLRHGFQFPA